jgi:hypothetical protein
MLHIARAIMVVEAEEREGEAVKVNQTLEAVQKSYLNVVVARLIAFNFAIGCILYP